jgi:regulator of replication initiation timing
MEDLNKKLDFLEKNIRSLTKKIDELLKENMKLREENKTLLEKEKNYMIMLKKLRERDQEVAFILNKLENLSDMIEKEIGKL